MNDTPPENTITEKQKLELAIILAAFMTIMATLALIMIIRMVR